MRFCSLGSGSKGNALLVHYKQTLVMIDNGFSVRETEKRLAISGMSAQQISAILVTHEHADHVNGVGALARKYNLSVYTTRGTLDSGRLGEIPLHKLFNSHTDFDIKDLSIQPFPVPHDAAEPCQFVISNGQRRLGILTDTGCSTPHIVESLSGVDALFLECNHDVDMLENGDYPYNVKVRVGGDYGHLNNLQAAGLLAKLDTSNLQHLVAAHISEKHNTPALARKSLSNALHCPQDWIAVAEQSSGLDWREIC